MSSLISKLSQAEAKLHDADARCLGLEAELRHAKEDARSKNATAPSLRSEAEGQLHPRAPPQKGIGMFLCASHACNLEYAIFRNMLVYIFW